MSQALRKVRRSLAKSVPRVAFPVAVSIRCRLAFLVLELQPRFIHEEKSWTGEATEHESYSEHRPFRNSTLRQPQRCGFS
jgi:hypothetical protein